MTIRDAQTYLRAEFINRCPPAYDDPSITPEQLHEKRLEVIRRCNYDKEESRYWLTALGLIPDKYPEPPNFDQRKHADRYRDKDRYKKRAS